MKDSFFLLCFIFFSTLGLCGQTKFEREYRLNSVQVPAESQAYLASLGATKKIKWYKEISQSGISIEGKTKINNACYSVEFDTTGVLEDVEIKIGWKNVEEPTQQSILQYLDSQFDKHSFQKIQRQFTGDSEKIKRRLTTQELIDGITISYEIIVKGKKNRRVKLYEFLFSERGEFIASLPIELRNTDNLEY